LGGGWEVKALLLRRHGAGNVLERAVGFSFYQWHTTFCIRIVADFGTQIFQFMMKLKRATTLEFTTISAIIFILCCKQFLY